MLRLIYSEGIARLLLPDGTDITDLATSLVLTTDHNTSNAVVTFPVDVTLGSSKALAPLGLKLSDFA